ncbi:MAG: site-specific DNA-methyltransferase [Opitutaceae bacterium]|nr:site-specific DNA-methyltransferase [Opitutaceae bacterium]
MPVGRGIRSLGNTGQTQARPAACIRYNNPLETIVTKKQKLELAWIGKENRPRLEPRILLEDPEKSYHAAHRVTDHDRFDNRLIFGDNLLALKALEQELTGKIRCIYIDPPYNTGSAFQQYDDDLEHSTWLSLIRDRVEILHRLLRPDGSLWVSLDDSEAHYFKVMVDEIFGRQNFIADISWRKRDGPPNDRRMGSVHEHVLLWGHTKLSSSKKTLAEEAFNLMPRTEKANAEYRVHPEPDGPDPRGPFRKIDTTAHGKGGRFVQSLFYAIQNPYTKEDVWPRKGTCWRHNRGEMKRLQADRRLYWGVNGTATTPMRKLFISEAKQGMCTPTIWDDVGLNQHATGEMEDLFGEKAFFETPKPEGLLQRIIHVASNPGDLVLDSFAGSGTTGAVAHKMGRRWIMVELGEHCHTHIIPRLKKVIDGADAGGITDAVGWKGGGGFRYYRLAPSLLTQDKWGNWVISKEYNAPMLAEAVCKLEGFTYAPSDTVYWQQGRSTERDFLYVTTASLSHDQLQQLSDEVGPERTLLVVCSAFRGRKEGYPNLTVKKIPKAVLTRCEWGHDDYSLKVENLPKAPPPAGQMELI